MRNGKHPATAVLRAFIDREVAQALQRLRIPSLAALERERGRYKEHCPLDAPGFGEVRDDITARLEALEVVDGLTGAGCDGVPLETRDEWVVELRDLLPKALTRPLTREERAEVFATVDAAKAAEKAEQERERLEWERSAEGKKWQRAIARIRKRAA